MGLCDGMAHVCTIYLLRHLNLEKIDFTVIRRHTWVSGKIPIA